MKEHVPKHESKVSLITEWWFYEKALASTCRVETAFTFEESIWNLVLLLFGHCTHGHHEDGWHYSVSLETVD